MIAAGNPIEPGSMTCERRAGAARGGARGRRRGGRRAARRGSASAPAACEPRAGRPISSPTPTSRPSRRSAVLAARRPGDAILGEEGGETAAGGRASLGRRSARRHDQLPLRDPGVRGQRRLRGRVGHARRRRARPDPRGVLRGHALRRADAERRPIEPTAAPSRSTSRWSPPASTTTPPCEPVRRGHARGCCRACATSAASAPPRSTSAGAPAGATTPTTSAG